MSRAALSDLLLFALFVALAGLLVFGVRVLVFDGRPVPVAPVPSLASDCRAACTLEGLAFVGVEVTPLQHSTAARCLCAPVPE